MGQEEQEHAAEGSSGGGGSSSSSLLRTLLQLITLLIASSHTIRAFPAKWQLIRNRLEQVHSALADAEESAASPHLLGLLQSMSSTAAETQALAHRCADESYAGGKLLLKSDLDVITAKLDLHVKRLEETYASGNLTLSRAIVVSRPAAGAGREDMRFYVKDLISRAKIGDSEMRLRALRALNEVLREDDKYVRILVLEVAEGVAFLVGLLESECGGVQEEVAEAISLIACFDSHKGALVMAGAIAPLIRALEMGSGLAKERTARALKKLTENSDNAWSVSAQGGVHALLKICGDADCGSELIRLACGVLKSLSGVEEIKRFMAEEGAVSIFLRLSRSKDESLQVQAIEFLCILATEDDAIKQRVINEGVLASLLQSLDSTSPNSSKAKEVALRAIDALCFSSPNAITHLMSSGFLDRVLFLLKSGEISIQESALKAVSRLSGLSEVVKKAMGDAGFIPELVRLLDARSFQVREMAAEALSGIVSVQRNRRRFVQEEDNVNRILQLLNPEEKSVTKKFLLSALMALTDSTTVRRKIVASGCLKHLEKLAESDVMDAKKIIKKLSTGRFRSMLTGIWSSRTQKITVKTS